MKIWLQATIGFSLIAMPAIAQSLQGDVQLEDGTPVANYPVIVKDPLGSTSVVITNPNGEFELPIENYGEYIAQPYSNPNISNQISIEKPGFFETIRDNNDIGKIVISPF